ncbi:MAG: hypothetical protein ACYDAE_00275 [Steroidobacteraceae bacterium]
MVWKPNGNLGFTKSAGGTTFTSWVPGANGQYQNDPGALNIEFDIPIAPADQSQGKAVLRVWGVGLQMIGQAANLNLQNFRLLGGMKAGLPLANPAQAGLLVQGQIFQGFGNWAGLNQTLDLIVYPAGTGTNANISFNWPKGTQLSSALARTLAQAFPQYKPRISISQNLALATTEAGTYSTLAAFGEYLSDLTVRIGTPIYGETYPGVAITIRGNTIVASDGTVQTPPIQLAFQDLIGQPTWIGPTEITFRTVLRADIPLLSFIKFPLGILTPYALTSPEAAVPYTPARSKSVFQGSFFVNEIHHFANFRQADGDSWVSVFKAIAVGVPP